MEILEVIRNRRSVRIYSGERIDAGSLDLILQAGLLAPSGKNKKPWEFILVRDRDTLKKLASCRNGQAAFLENAEAAIVVAANTVLTDTWVEDCAIAMAQMHLMAEAVGVGSCWIQGRLREAANGQTADAYVRQLLQIPEGYALEAILSLGIPAKHPAAHNLENLPLQKIHREHF